MVTHGSESGDVGYGSTSPGYRSRSSASTSTLPGSSGATSTPAGTSDNTGTTGTTGTTYGTRTTRARDESVLGLVGGMARDLGTLVRQEATLLRVELGEKLDVLKAGLASVATGGLVTFAGLIFLILAAVLVLDEALDSPWLSTLIVGGIVTIIGLALLGRGRSKLSASSMVPERSARSLQKDVGLAKEEVRELRRNP